MELSLLNPKLCRNRTAFYDLLMATGLVLMYGAVRAALKLYDVAWRFLKIVYRADTERTYTTVITDDENETNLRLVDDFPVKRVAPMKKTAA